MKDLTINLTTEEQKDRYNYIKDLTQRLYPKVASDITLGNMSEYLYIYYAIHEKFPDPPEGTDTEPIGFTNIPMMEEYHTPANIADTLKRPEPPPHMPNRYDDDNPEPEIDSSDDSDYDDSDEE